MTRTYITYGLTILSAIYVFKVFGIFSSTNYSYGLIATSALIMSQIQFGFSSWVFLHFPKAGKMLAVLTTTIMCIWPAEGFVLSMISTDWYSSLNYFIPVLLGGVVVFNHLKFINDTTKPPLPISVLLTIVPLGLFLFYFVSRFILWKSMAVSS